jgi:methylamine dehydrogenase light chain
MNPGNLLQRINAWFDKKAVDGSRYLARRTSRRSFLGRLGTGIVGIGSLPLLPVLRAFGAEAPDELGDPKRCDYWRYCAISGTLCSCCGGTHSSCPPGSEPATIHWVGTCRNPVDDKDYLIAYNDCCGKAFCNRCDCHRTEREKPLYFPSRHASITWCFGAESRSYHCTMALVVGQTK